MPGETLPGNDFQIALGGKGANQAVACARLGGAAAFVARVGDDAVGRHALATYESAGLAIDTVGVVAAVPTGSALIFVADSGENSIGVAPGANAHLDLTAVEAAATAIRAADFLLMQLEVPIASVARAAQIAAAGDTTVIVNPAPATPLPAGLLAQVDILTPNETELSALSGEPVGDQDSTVAAARVLLRQGVDTIIVTRGAAGALIVDTSAVQEIPAPSVEPLDTTAAGDTFNGALAVALAEQLPLAEAVAFANRAAALSVTRRGALDAIPTRREVDAFR